MEKAGSRLEDLRTPTMCWEQSKCSWCYEVLPEDRKPFVKIYNTSKSICMGTCRSLHGRDFF